MGRNSPSREILLEAYRTRVQLLITQGNRLWVRFNYFLAIEIALGALFYLHDKSVAAIIGFVFSLIWYWIAANDHYHLKLDRRRVKLFEEAHFEGITPLYNERIEMK